MNLKEYVEALETELRANANSKIAKDQKAYLRNQFEFYGISTTHRREIQKPFLALNHLPAKENAIFLIKKLWYQPQREYQYFCQELAFKYLKQLAEKDIEWLEFMIVNKSWWDTVDFISSKLIGSYFKKFPAQKAVIIPRWLKSNNIWLQRTAILFQLKYKKDLDKELLTSIISSLLGSKEFFINKAIGWVLREYSKTNPDWVLDFVNTATLSSLSKKEALRLL